MLVATHTHAHVLTKVGAGCSNVVLKDSLRRFVKPAVRRRFVKPAVREDDGTGVRRRRGVALHNPTFWRCSRHEKRVVVHNGFAKRTVARRIARSSPLIPLSSLSRRPFVLAVRLASNSLPCLHSPAHLNEHPHMRILVEVVPEHVVDHDAQLLVADELAAVVVVELEREPGSGGGVR